MHKLKGKNVLHLGSREIDYTVSESPESKHIQLKLRPDFGLEVTIPSDSEINVDTILRKKAKWIEKKCDELQNSKRIFNGNKVLYKGEYRDTISLMSGESSDSLKEWMSRETEKLVKERLADFEKKLNFSHNGFLVRDMKKWGYCTKDGRLVFSWQLIALPEELSDYVILHELAHLKAFNHSKRFKYTLASFCPDFREREALLKQFISS